MSLRTLLVLVLLALPLRAAAERVVTRSGNIYEGATRFEGDEVIVLQADGSEVRIPRAEVVRIDPPPEERDTPPPSPSPQFVPPTPPKMRESATLTGGLGVAIGYHRGYSVGVEWQRPLKPGLTLGLGGQVGVELVSPSGKVFTWGVNGRVYAGLSDRFVLDLGYGLNLAKVVPCQGSGCPDFIRNLGPEVAAGYQHLTHGGFFIEGLVGIAFATEPRIRADREVSPTFQLSAGYLFH